MLKAIELDQAYVLHINVCVYMYIKIFFSTYVCAQHSSKKMREVKKNKRQLICNTHMEEFWFFSSAFYKEHTKEVKQFHQPLVTSLQHN